MKNILPFIFLFLFQASLWAQKHSFGVKAGGQLQAVLGRGIDSGDERLFFIERNSTQAHLGFYYRQQLDKWLFLEAAPLFYRENIEANYYGTLSGTSNLGESLIQTTNLYFPVLIRLDLGYQLSFTAGAGAILFLEKKKTDGELSGEQEKKIYADLLERYNNWPINLEVGLSYGIGRFSINGKYVYRISKSFDDLTIAGKNYPIDFKMDAFQIDLSYQLR